MSECASESGRETKKKSALSPESQSCMEERRVSRKKKIDWYHKFLPITFHFQVMKAVEQKSWSTVAPAR